MTEITRGILLRFNVRQRREHMREKKDNKKIGIITKRILSSTHTLLSIKMMSILI
jgi:hypothetical protein